MISFSSSELDSFFGLPFSSSVEIGLSCLDRLAFSLFVFSSVGFSLRFCFLGERAIHPRS